MKKALTFLVLLGLVSSVSAASFLWQLSSIAFGGSTLKSASESDFTAYLVYLGNGGELASSYDAAAIASMTASAVDSVAGTTAKGAASSTYYLPDVSDYTTYNGDVYGVLLSYVSEGKTYYNLGSATYEVTGLADATSSLSAFKPAAATFTYGTSAEGSSVSAGSGWVAVPEPSTAALALAGLALLLKRRKA